MRSIDIHAHIAPAIAANLESGKEWHGFTRQEISGRQVLVSGDKRAGLHPSYLITPEERIANMDSLGVDVHVARRSAVMLRNGLVGTRLGLRR